MRNASGIASLVCLLVSGHSIRARAQADAHASNPVGTFVGQDSLDARKEAASTSRARRDLHGSATWTIELDSLDLRRKFTLRLELPEPSAVTIVLRSLDSLPPRPGEYTVMIPATGASHSQAGTMHGDVYTRERDRNRQYLPARSRVVITSVTMAGGQPVVTGSVDMRSDRYADAPPRTLVFDYVSLDVRGDFAARAAPNMRPRVVVTAGMQEAVLRRALDGFVITHAGAINGDGYADSTRQPGAARHFLETRWRDAATIERVETTPRRFEVRLRGRLVPVVCEVESAKEDIDCVTLPTPVVAPAGAASGSVSGRLAVRLARGAVATGSGHTVRLLPNPLSRKETLNAWCDARDMQDSVAAQGFTEKLESIKDTAAQRAAVEAFASTFIQSFRQSFDSLVTSFAVQKVAVGANGQFTFGAVPPGNYVLFAALSGEARDYDWYVPIAVRAGERLTRELDASTANEGGFVCGMPFPFPVIRERDR